jgi:hypothetical protein
MSQSTLTRRALVASTAAIPTAAVLPVPATATAQPRSATLATRTGDMLRTVALFAVTSMLGGVLVAAFVWAVPTACIFWFADGCPSKQRPWGHLQCFC